MRDELAAILALVKEDEQGSCNSDGEENELGLDALEELGKGDGGWDRKSRTVSAIPVNTPAMTFEMPKAPKLIAVAAIALPRMAAETGLEQENTRAAIRAGERKRM